MRPTKNIDIERRDSVPKTEKGLWERPWPVIAYGAGLFSDGYLNNIIGLVNTTLKTISSDSYTNFFARANAASIAFAGNGSFSLRIVIILFAILGTASYGAGVSPSGLLTALVVYRFFLGIGIGGEYPAGSVGCAESTGELKQAHRTNGSSSSRTCKLILPSSSAPGHDQEDVKFRVHLMTNGYDTTKMGLESVDTTGTGSDENVAVPVEQTYGK